LVGVCISCVFQPYLETVLGGTTRAVKRAAGRKPALNAGQAWVLGGLWLNGLKRTKEPRLNRALKWSHFFSEMEILFGMGGWIITVPAWSFNGATSFQKWKFGVVTLSATNLLPNGFQWSHFFSEMEMLNAELTIEYLQALFQWSHFFSEMEILGTSAILTAKSPSFNGATSFQKWK
jgi:hypothetical protein